MSGLMRRPILLLGVGLTMGLLVGAGMLIGGLAATAWLRPTQDVLSPTLLHAAGASSNDSFAVATGTIEDSEGLFMLDFLTGELRCFVINGRVPTAPPSVFTINASQVLQVEQGKKPKYVMAAGNISFRPSGRFASSVVYVADANSGRFAAFGVPWNRNYANSGRPQSGIMTVVTRGMARNVEIE